MTGRLHISTDSFPWGNHTLAFTGWVWFHTIPNHSARLYLDEQPPDPDEFEIDDLALEDLSIFTNPQEEPLTEHTMIRNGARENDDFDGIPLKHIIDDIYHSDWILSQVEQNHLDAKDLDG
jgi:hypothetical protein